MEALACLKLSTVYSNFGDAERAAEAAEAAGQSCAARRLDPPGCVLEGNLAVTRASLHHYLRKLVICASAAAWLSRPKGGASTLSGAIGFHNLGEMELPIGDIAGSL